MDNKLKKSIKKWLKDFENTQYGGCQIDEDTFEGGAYYLLKACIEEKGD